MLSKSWNRSQLENNRIVMPHLELLLSPQSHTRANRLQDTLLILCNIFTVFPSVMDADCNKMGARDLTETSIVKRQAAGIGGVGVLGECNSDQTCRRRYMGLSIGTDNPYKCCRVRTRTGMFETRCLRKPHFPLLSGFGGLGEGGFGGGQVGGGFGGQAGVVGTV